MKSYKFNSFIVSLLFGAIIALGTALTTYADITIYNGIDNGVYWYQSRPNSNAAANSFDAAVGVHNVITFENLQSGPIYSYPFVVYPGVSVELQHTSTSYSDMYGGITTDQNIIWGYNTTSGPYENKHLRVVPQLGTSDVLVTFYFSNPINFFGAYITGTEDSMQGPITVNFNDGSSQSLALPKNSDQNGGVEFFGFTDFGSNILSVQFREAGPFTTTRDVWGIDDVRFGSVQVPEPGILVLLGISMMSLVGLKKWWKD